MGLPQFHSSLGHAVQVKSEGIVPHLWPHLGDTCLTRTLRMITSNALNNFPSLLVSPCPPQTIEAIFFLLFPVILMCWRLDTREIASETPTVGCLKHQETSELNSQTTQKMLRCSMFWSWDRVKGRNAHSKPIGRQWFYTFGWDRFEWPSSQLKVECLRPSWGWNQSDCLSESRKMWTGKIHLDEGYHMHCWATLCAVQALKRGLVNVTARMCLTYLDIRFPQLLQPSHRAVFHEAALCRNEWKHMKETTV